MYDELLDEYLAGAETLRTAVHGMTSEQLVAKPVPGTWSTLEVLCHLADSESLFAERMKRILAEDRPALPFADPDLFSKALAYQRRDAQVEVDLIDLTRKQMVSILRALPSESWSRAGIHSKSGPCTLEQVVTKAVTHLRHHLAFIHQKRQALGMEGANRQRTP